MIPARYAPYLFALILSGMMSFLVSGFATWRALGLPPDFVSIWLGAWIGAWAIAFPAATLVAPVARRIVARLTA